MRALNYRVSDAVYIVRMGMGVVTLGLVTEAAFAAPAASGTGTAATTAPTAPAKTKRAKPEPTRVTKPTKAKPTKATPKTQKDPAKGEPVKKPAGVEATAKADAPTPAPRANPGEKSAESSSAAEEARAPASAQSTDKNKPRAKSKSSSKPANVPPPVPLNPAFMVGLMVDNTWNTDPAYDYFSKNDLATRVGVSALWNALEFSPMILAIGAEYLGGSTSARQPSNGVTEPFISRAELASDDVGGVLSLRYSIVDWLAPALRASGGVSFVSTELSGVDFGSANQKFTTPYFTVGAGLMLHSPTKRLSDTRRHANSIAVVGIIEGGWMNAKALDFNLPGADVSQPDQQPAQEIRVASTPLGTLQRSGPYLRIGAMIEF